MKMSKDEHVIEKEEQDLPVLTTCSGPVQVGLIGGGVVAA